MSGSGEPSNPRKAWKSYGLLFLGVGGISTATLWIRLSGTAGDLEAGLAGELAFRRLAFALPVLYLWARIARTPVVPAPGTHGRFVASGVLLAGHFLLWIESLAYLPTPTSLMLVSLHPVIVFAIEASRGRFPFQGQGIVGILLALFGTALLAEEPREGAVNYHRGVALAVASAASMAGYLIAGRSLRRTVAASSYAFVVYAIAAAVLGIVVLFRRGELLPSTSEAWGLAVLLAVFPTLLGHTPLNAALERLPATIVSTAFLGEVVGGSILVWVFVDEPLPREARFYLGCPVVAIGIIAVSLAGSRISFPGFRSDREPRRRRRAPRSR